jgi:hypothetical protein
LTLKWQKELGLTLLLVLLALLAYGQLLEPGATPYSPHSDLLAQHLAMKNVAYESLRVGEGLPHWKSDMLGGGPALTHPQALFTHPLQILFLIFEPTAAAGPTLLLHFLAMALSLQVLGAVMGLGYASRSFMAVAGLFSFKMLIIGYAGWLPVLPGLVLAPLLFAAVLKIMQRPGPSGALLMAIAGTLALHGGHLQIFYYSTLALAMYLGVQLVHWVRADRAAHAAIVVTWCAVGAFLACLCTAYLLLPLLADSLLTTRVAPSYDFFQSRGAYAPETLTTFLHPEAFGTPIDNSYEDVELWEDVAYFGLIPLVLALFGMTFGDNRYHKRFLVVGFWLSILLVFDTPVLRLMFDFVPGFSLFRHPSRLLFLTVLFGIPLSAIGLERLLTQIDQRLPDGQAVRITPALVALLIVLITAEGAYYARRYITMAPSVEVVPQTRYEEFLSSDSSLFRVAPIGRHTVNYGWGSFMQLELVSGFDAYNYRHYERYIGLLTRGVIPPDEHVVWTDLNSIARIDLLDALNVKYLLVNRMIPSPPPQLGLIKSFPKEPAFVFYGGLNTAPIHIYENGGVLPRSYFATEIAPARDEQQALELALRLDLRQTTIVEGDGMAPTSFDVPENATLDFVDRKNDSYLLESRNDERGFAVVGEIWHPGWKATLDGEPIKLHRTNIAQMGASLPAGKHRLSFEFRPLYWTLARALSLIGAIGVIALTGLAFKSRLD